MNIDLSGEIALVTGGSRGIGRAIALALGEAGARVAVHYRAAEREAQEVVRALPGAAAFAADLEDEAQVRRLHEGVVGAMGPVTILVNNAGVYEDVPIDGSGALERYRRLMRVNLDAAFLLCHLVAPAMKERRKGVLLNISSRSGERGEPQAAHYAMSKGAMNAMTISLARELAPFGVRANAIAPGWVETSMTAPHLAAAVKRAEVEGETLLRRVGQPEDIAGLALFLVSPRASYITAQIVHVNGGSYLNT
ncbi:MAG: SDR family oxidoreductase [Planctomycetes bacterium]|nr:SDR family oxidoreductase [Planctomycetota bacterium]